MLLGLEISCEIFPSFGELHFDALTLLDLSIRNLLKVQFKSCLLLRLWRYGVLVWIESINWIAWIRGLAGGTGGRKKLYGVLPYLLYLRSLEEPICEIEGSFKVIIWGWQATKGIRVGVTYDFCLSMYLKIQETLYNPRYIEEYQILETYSY